MLFPTGHIPLAGDLAPLKGTRIGIKVLPRVALACLGTAPTYRLGTAICDRQEALFHKLLFKEFVICLISRIYWDIQAGLNLSSLFFPSASCFHFYQ